MDVTNRDRIATIWRQETIPVIYRQGKGHLLMVRLPNAENNLEWLRHSNRRKPKKNKTYNCWVTPLAWFEDIVTRSLYRYNNIYIIQPYNPQERCASSCWDSNGYECQSSQHIFDNCYIVSENFSANWREKVLACKLLVRKDDWK